jgi:predicted nucleic acid-binding protein
VKYLLDTNTCIRYLNGRAPSIQQRMATIRTDDIVVCAPVKAELFYFERAGSTPLKRGHAATSVGGVLTRLRRAARPRPTSSI